MKELTIRKVKNGFIVESPYNPNRGEVRAIEDLLVYETLEALQTFLADNFRELAALKKGDQIHWYQIDGVRRRGLANAIDIVKESVDVCEELGSPYATVNRRCVFRKRVARERWAVFKNGTECCVNSFDDQKEAHEMAARYTVSHQGIASYIVVHFREVLKGVK